VDSQQHGIEVETVDAEIDAFSQTQAATVEQQNDQAVGRLQVSQDGLYFATGQYHRYVTVALGTNDTVDFTKISTQDVAEEEEKRVKGLIL
jgi:hypothetical protein